MKQESKTRFGWDTVSRYRDEIFGLSILWIMIFHGFLVDQPRFFTWPGVSFLGNRMIYGNMGCEIFMLLSGIGLYFSYTRDPHPGRFYLKRLKRIFLPVVLICGPYWIWQLSRHKYGIWRFFQRLFLLDFWIEGNQQVWFVSVILVCYLLFPLLYRLIYTKKSWSWAVTALLMAAFLGLCFLVKGWSRSYFEDVYIGLVRIPTFILGIFLGQFVYEKKTGPGWVWLLLGAVVMVSFDLLENHVFRGMYLRLAYILPGAALTFVLGGLIHLYPQKHICAVLRFLGRISLEIYLSHIILIRLYRHGQFLYPYGAGSRSRYAGLLAAAVLISFIVSRIEKLILHKGGKKNALHR